MMREFETFENSSIQDPLIAKQREDVSRMRASLLACDGDIRNVTYALQSITVLRVYHQVSRIIRYLDMMDKIELKLYEHIDYKLSESEVGNTKDLFLLLELQERLQKSLIESHKILQPYLNIDELNLNNIITTTSDYSEDNSMSVIPKSSRDKLRLSAQQVLLALDDTEV